jgi:hypothetical protein
MDRLSKASKKRLSRTGADRSIKRLTYIEVSLDDLEIRMALKLGDGDLKLGIRRAVVFASMRPF